jgi:glycosyltransferase involved in cell wall biosynthesis
MIMLYIAEANAHSRSPGSNRCMKFIEYFGAKFSEIRHINPVKYQVSQKNTRLKSDQSGEYQKIRLRLKEKLHSRMVNSSIFSVHFISCMLKLIVCKARGFRPDLIYISYKPPSVIILGFFAKLLFRCKLIVEYRDLASTFSDSKRSVVIKKIDFYLEWLFLKLVNEVVVVSPSQASRFSSNFGRDAHIVLNGIDPLTIDIPQSKFDQPATTKKNPIIIYAGTLSHRRNLNPFAKIMRALDLNLKVFSRQDPLIFIDDETLCDVITFDGFRTRSYLINEYSKADGFLLLEGYSQSSYENIPSKVFEYIYFKKPIYFCGNINSDVGQILIDLGLLMHISEDGVLTNYLDENKLKNNYQKYLRVHQFQKLEGLILNAN